MTTTDQTTTRPALIDLPAVAELLGVTERHVRRLVAERRIPFYKWGHFLRFDPDEVKAWIREHRIGPVHPFDARDLVTGTR